jgi:hypothetical protein
MCPFSAPTEHPHNAKTASEHRQCSGEGSLAAIPGDNRRVAILKDHLTVGRRCVCESRRRSAGSAHTPSTGFDRCRCRGGEKRDNDRALI